MADELFNYSGKLAYLQAVCRDPRLGRSELAVMSVLVDHADKATGSCYPSIARMTDTGNVSRSSAIRALRRLEQTGWIKSAKRIGALSTYLLTSSEDATGATLGTGVISARTGVKSNLRQGRTGSGDDTKAVPGMTPEQEKSKSNRLEQVATNAADAAHPIDLWRDGIQMLVSTGTAREQAGAAIGKLRKELGEDEAVNVVRAMLTTRPTGPKSYIFGAIKQRKNLPPRGMLLRDARSDDDIAAANEAATRRLLSEVSP